MLDYNKYIGTDNKYFEYTYKEYIIKKYILSRKIYIRYFSDNIVGIVIKVIVNEI